MMIDCARPNIVSIKVYATLTFRGRSEGPVSSLFSFLYVSSGSDSSSESASKILGNWPWAPFRSAILCTFPWQPPTVPSARLRSLSAHRLWKMAADETQTEADCNPVVYLTRIERFSAAHRLNR